MNNKLVILTGTSGIGKTTTFIPAFKRAGFKDCSSGNAFKAQIGAAIEPWYVFDPIPTKLYEGVDALNFMFDTGAIDRGVEIYERKFKHSATGFTTCLFPEAFQRSLLRDAPVQFTAMFAARSPLGVCEVINQTEYEDLVEICDADGIDVITVCLDCENPKQRDSGNRSRVTKLITHSEVIQYRLEESNQAAEDIVERVRAYWL